MKKLTLLSILVLFLFFSISCFAAPKIDLWIEGGWTTYWTNVTVSFAASTSDSDGIKKVCLYDGDRQICKEVPVRTGYQIFFVFLEEQVGNHTYRAQGINTKGETTFSNEIILTFIDPIKVNTQERRYEPNGWFREFADYNGDGKGEWSRPFLTIRLPLKERDMNADGQINIQDIVLSIKWNEGKIDPNKPAENLAPSRAINNGITIMFLGKIKTN